MFVVAWRAGVIRVVSVVVCLSPLSVFRVSASACRCSCRAAVAHVAPRQRTRLLKSGGPVVVTSWFADAASLFAAVQRRLRGHDEGMVRSRQRPAVSSVVFVACLWSHCASTGVKVVSRYQLTHVGSFVRSLFRYGAVGGALLLTLIANILTPVFVTTYQIGARKLRICLCKSRQVTQHDLDSLYVCWRRRSSSFVRCVLVAACLHERASERASERDNGTAGAAVTQLVCFHFPFVLCRRSRLY